jgi:hypothetical protein
VFSISLAMNTQEGMALMYGLGTRSWQALGWPLAYRVYGRFYPWSLATNIIVTLAIAGTLSWIVEYSLRVTFNRNRQSRR